MKERIRIFFELDEGMKEKLRVDEVFRRASNEYVEARDEMIFKRLKNGDRAKRAARVVDSLGRTRGVRNGFAYCLWFEEETMSRVNHRWGPCPWDKDGAVCNTYGTWLRAWEKYIDFEVEALNYTSMEIYRDGQHEYMRNKLNNRMNELYLRVTQNNHNSWNLLNDAQGVSLSTIANHLGRMTCFNIIHLEINFTDYFHSMEWFLEGYQPGPHFPVNPPTPPDPDPDPNPTPGDGEGEWNRRTHSVLLETMCIEAGLTVTEYNIFLQANDWCDSFIEGNQWSSMAHLHAMRKSADQSTEEALTDFKEHIEKHFNLFLNDTTDFWSLGIALHGIADSFCPGHAGFQYLNLFNIGDIMEHAYWDEGQHSQDCMSYAKDTMVTIIRILTGFFSLPEEIDLAEEAKEFWLERYNERPRL